MDSSIAEQQAVIQKVAITGDALSVDLTDGRTVSTPLVWYPRLLHGTTGERANWELIGGGTGIHWPDIDEDISLDGILAGRRSCESQESLRRWLVARKA